MRRSKGNPDPLLDAEQRHVPVEKQLAFERRQLTNRHNALTGGIGQAKAAMQGIINAATTTQLARDRAATIFNLLLELDQEVRARRILPGDPA